MRLTFIFLLFFLGCNQGKLCVYKNTVSGINTSIVYTLEAQYQYCSINSSGGIRNGYGLTINTILIEETDNTDLKRQLISEKYSK